MLERQREVEKGIQAEYEAKSYSLTSPLIIQNPYGSAPLTALLVFDTAEEAQISIHIPGHTAQASVDFDFPGFRRHHEIPVYGLYPGETNPVTVSAVSQSGDRSQANIDLTTEDLPTYLERIELISADRASYHPGFNVSFLEHKNIYDIDGIVRWYSVEKSSQVFKRLANGRYLFNYDIEGEQTPLVMEQDLLGKIYSVYHIPDGLHHDIEELSNGNFLATTEDLEAGTLEDIIVELDRQTGHIVRYIDLQDYLSRYRPIEIGMPQEDWFHLNSIIFDPVDQSIIISGRTQSAVVKFTYPEMQIKWILGTHDYWSDEFQQYLLKPQGDDFEWPWSQHHATLYDEHIPGETTIDVLLFDNGLHRSFEPEYALPAAESYSRVVHYRINEADNTIEQVWQYGKEAGSQLFSVSRGSAYALENGNVLGTWSELVKDEQGQAALVKDVNMTIETRLIEISPETGKIVYECSFPDVAVYRVMRAGLYDGYAEEGNLMGITVNDTSASDFYDRTQQFMTDVDLRQSQAIVSIKQLAHQILNDQ